MAQTAALSVNSASVNSGASVTVPLNAAFNNGAQAAGLEWTLNYPTADFTGLTVAAGPTATAAGKTVQCNPVGSGLYSCVVSGMNANVLQNGAVATITLTAANLGSVTNAAIQLQSLSATTPAADSVATTGSGGTVTINPLPASLKSITCAPTNVVSQGSTVCTVSLTAAAPIGGTTVSLGYVSSPSVPITIPSVLAISAGQSSGSFTVTFGTINSVGTLQITAAMGSATVNFTVGFSPVPIAPVISAVTAAPSSSAATISWTTDQAASSHVDYGTVSTALTSSVSSATLTTSHSLSLTGLLSGTTYYYRVTSANAAGISTTFPVTTSSPLNFVTQSLPTTISIWPATAKPVNITDSDPNSVELGLKFQSDVAGTVSGVRFYKGPQNTGTHTGHLWSSSGSLLASVTFTGETSQGWQQANFTSSVSITANQTYIISYYAPVGRYSADSPFFSKGAVNNPPLHALADGAVGPNGVYTYGASAFPASSYNSSNYWVDVVFSPTQSKGPSISIDSASTTPAGSFVADEDYVGGSVNPIAAPVNVTGVANAAPQQVYQTKRTSNSAAGFTYTIPGLPANAPYNVRLHFADDLAHAAGIRVFNVSINGTSVLNNFDIFATAGSYLKAVVETFTTTVNGNGQIVIQFTPGLAGNALASGIEVFPQ